MLPFANYYISTPIMSEKKSITRTIKNRKKSRWSPTLFIGEGGVEDELATVKAAAWAWYQRHEGKPMMREFDVTRRATIRTPRPSRYKLEANKNMILSENRASKPHIDDLLCGDQETNKFSSLLDTYEIKSISKRIDEGSLPTSVFKNDHNMVHEKENGMERIRNLWKGMGLIMASRRVCGRTDDVDLTVYRTGPRRDNIARRTSLNTRTYGQNRS